MNAAEVESRVLAIVSARPGSRFAEVLLTVPRDVRPAAVFDALTKLSARGELHCSGRGNEEHPTACKYSPRRTT